MELLSSYFIYVNLTFLGATPSQYGFVFGVCNLAALLTAPLIAKFGVLIGPKLLYNIGTIFQALSSLAFGFLAYVDNLHLFLGLSYFFRF